MEVKGLFSKDQTIGKINEVQLGLISTLTSKVISLVSPVDTKQVWKAVWYRTASVRMRNEWYDIVSFWFLGHFSVSPSFWTCFGMDRLIFFVPMWMQPLSVLLFGMHQSGTVQYCTMWTGPRRWAYDCFD